MVCSFKFSLKTLDDLFKEDTKKLCTKLANLYYSKLSRLSNNLKGMFVTVRRPGKVQQNIASYKDDKHYQHASLH